MLPLRLSPDVSAEIHGDLTILASRQGHADAVVYLHGFPGPYEMPPSTEVRVADEVFAAVRSAVDFFYPLYTLKPEGRFDFRETLVDARRALDVVRSGAGYRTITVIGQSWGAVLAAELCRGFTPARVLLVTPFVAVPAGRTAHDLLAHHATNHPRVLSRPLGEYVRQIETIARDHDPLSIVNAPRVPTTVYAATEDDVVPFARLEALCAPAVRFVPLPGESHRIQGRAALARRIATALGL